MLVNTGAQGRQWWQLISVALYAVFLVTAPFEHHDLSCELKTPFHCTACVSSQVGSDPQAAVIPAIWHLDDAGRAVSLPVIAHGVLLVVHTPGRSPPAVL